MKTIGFRYVSAFVFVLLCWNVNRLQIFSKHRLVPAGGTMSVTETPGCWQFNTTFPVDLVYTWVDGSDPRFNKVLDELKYQIQKTKSFSATNIENLAPNRFADNGALRFSLRSMEKYANWIRHVFIVTNGQIPDWLNLRNPRVTIVEHKEIFDEPEYLPTFSSRAIEHNVHKIRGLSERFIYMNDDFFFGRNISLEDFYTDYKGTKVYLRGNAPTQCGMNCKMDMIKNGNCDAECNYDHCAWDGGDCDDISRHIRPKDFGKANNDYINSIFYTNALYNREFGNKTRRMIPHVPLFMEISVKKDMDTWFPGELKKVRRRQLRSPLDFNFQFSYTHFLMEAYNHSRRFEERVYSPDVAFIMVTTNLEKTRHDLDKLRNSKRKFICINDNINYSNQIKAIKTADLVREFYESMFPNPSSFEIPI